MSTEYSGKLRRRHFCGGDGEIFFKNHYFPSMLPAFDKRFSEDVIKLA